MLRCLALLGVLAFTAAGADAPFIGDAHINQNGTLVFSVDYQTISENPEFQILTSSSVSAPEESWVKIPAATRSAPGSSKWIIELLLPGDNMAFYRVEVTDDIISTANSGVIISEICSANTSLLEDMDGDFSDWIELYNSGDENVSLQGWSLSDSVDERNKWIFPDLSLKPGDLQIIFASGKDRRDSGSEIHTSFKISANGETLLLSNTHGQVVDAIRIGSLDDDTTLGRAESTGSDWFQFQKASATPGKINAAKGIVFVEAPSFSSEPGFYPLSTELELSTLSENQSIRYSINGDDPFENGLDYDTPITLHSTSVLRAVSVDPNGNQSDEVTGTFFIRSPHSIAVISLAAPAHHFDIEDGFLYGFGDHMFSNRGTVNANFPYSASNAWRDREIPVSLELYEPDGELGFQQKLGVKIFGGWGSRGYPQKSLSFFARSKYGKGKVRYPLFPEMGLEEFESFVLRNSGNDNQSTHQIPPRSEINAFGRRRSNGSYFVNGNYTLMRDAMMQHAADHLNVDQQAYRPVIVYLNGDYWGIYNLREKLNEHYVASHHTVDADQIDLIEGYGSANKGTSTHYNRMRSYLEGGSLRSNTRYERVIRDYIDVSSFTDYHLAVIYFQNFDIGNIKQWRHRNDGTFRWMLYDQDYGFNLWPPEVYLPAMKRDFSDYNNMFEFYTNTSGSGTGWPNASGRTLLLRKMLENDSFKIQFINRCADLLNTDFESQRVVDIINEMASVIRGEMPEHLARWSWFSLLERNHGSPFDEEDVPFNTQQWEKNIDDLREFAESRPDKLRKDLMDHFNLKNGTCEIITTVEPQDAGHILINSITSQSLPNDRGIYFKGIPVVATAIANEGRSFQRWSNRETITRQITIDTTAPDQIHLHATFD